jgi:hypothetical protein
LETTYLLLLDHIDPSPIGNGQSIAIARLEFLFLIFLPYKLLTY